MRSSEVAAAVGDMPLLQAVRKEALNWLAQKLLEGIAEELGDGSVGFDNAALVIDDEQRVRRQFDELLEGAWGRHGRG
jgi:hypothetical protein